MANPSSRALTNELPNHSLPPHSSYNGHASLIPLNTAPQPLADALRARRVEKTIVGWVGHCPGAWSPGRDRAMICWSAGDEPRAIICHIWLLWPYSVVRVRHDNRAVLGSAALGKTYTWVSAASIRHKRNIALYGEKIGKWSIGRHIELSLNIIQKYFHLDIRRS